MAFLTLSEFIRPLAARLFTKPSLVVPEDLHAILKALLEEQRDKGRIRVERHRMAVKRKTFQRMWYYGFAEVILTCFWV